jgi:hypothetical protein
MKKYVILAKAVTERFIRWIMHRENRIIIAGVIL